MATQVIDEMTVYRALDIAGMCIEDVMSNPAVSDSPEWRRDLELALALVQRAQEGYKGNHRLVAKWAGNCKTPVVIDRERGAA